MTAPTTSLRYPVAESTQPGPAAIAGGAAGPGHTPNAILEGFAGAGGLSEGCRLLGLGPSLGIELNPVACAIAEAAGHPRLRSDIRLLDPASFQHPWLWASGPPCQTFTGTGQQSGIAERAKLHDAIEAVSDTDEMPDGFADPRTGLLLRTLDFAIQLPNVQVVIAEQVQPVREFWINMCAELATFHRFESVNVITVAADDLGLPTRRTRVFLIATRDFTPDLAGLPTRGHWAASRFGPGPVELPPNRSTPFPQTSMAQALGWPKGVRVNTRGDRSTSGGNLFKADGPAQTLTQSTRTWYRTDLGPIDGLLSTADAGTLQGFRRDYPWDAAGSRTSRFQRIADSVCPLVGSAVVGAALGLPWQDVAWDRLRALYGPAEPRSSQLGLFEAAS